MPVKGYDDRGVVVIRVEFATSTPSRVMPEVCDLPALWV